MWIGNGNSVAKSVLENPTPRRKGASLQASKSQPGFPPAGLQGGQAIAEFAFAFPLQLLVMFAIMQLALVYVAKQVVTYASYSAARAALVADTTGEAIDRADRAAALVCAPITGTTTAGANVSPGDLTAAIISVPGWGAVPKSGISHGLKTHVSALQHPAPGEIEVTVTHYYELAFPVVNYAFAWLHRGAGPAMPDATGASGTVPFGDEAASEDAMGIWTLRAPHMRLRETTRLAVPGG